MRFKLLLGVIALAASAVSADALTVKDIMESGGRVVAMAPDGANSVAITLQLDKAVWVCLMKPPTYERIETKSCHKAQ